MNNKATKKLKFRPLPFFIFVAAIFVNFPFIELLVNKHDWQILLTLRAITMPIVIVFCSKQIPNYLSNNKAKRWQKLSMILVIIMIITYVYSNGIRAAFDLCEGPQIYQGSCNIRVDTGRGGTRYELLTAGGNVLHLPFWHYNAFEGEWVWRSNFPHQCSSLINLVYLRNSGWILELSKLQ